MWRRPTPASPGARPGAGPARCRGRAGKGRARGAGRGADEDAAAILAFQLELLDDPALLARRGRRSARHVRGTRRDRALDAEIAGYEAAEDDYFRARAADLRDLKERILAALAGGGADRPEPPPGAIVAATPTWRPRASSPCTAPAGSPVPPSRPAVPPRTWRCSPAPAASPRHRLGPGPGRGGGGGRRRRPRPRHPEPRARDPCPLPGAGRHPPPGGRAGGRPTLRTRPHPRRRAGRGHAERRRPGRRQ